MLSKRDLPPSRAAVLFVLLGLCLTLAAASYMMFASRPATAETAAPAGEAAGVPVDVVAAKQLIYKLSILLASILLILVFVVGSYLLIRVGRAVTGKPIGGTATEYVDGWGSYRVTDEQIELATRETEPEGPEGDSGRAGDSPGSADDEPNDPEP